MILLFLPILSFYKETCYIFSFSFLKCSKIYIDSNNVCLSKKQSNSRLVFFHGIDDFEYLQEKINYIQV